MTRQWRRLIGVAILGTLVACSAPPLQSPDPSAAPRATGVPAQPRSSVGSGLPGTQAATLDPALAAELATLIARADTLALPAPLVQAKSRWQPVRWSELPGLSQDPLHEAWNAWLRSCERPAPPWGPLCAELRPLSIASPAEQLAWVLRRLQPYRIEPLSGETDGLLTAYFEPMLLASRTRQPGFEVPLYQPPAGLVARQPWYSRQDMDTLPAAQTALQGRAIAWLADPVDALVLQIQGSGRLQVTEPDGSRRQVRLAYAATNEQPYRSVGRWLLDQGAVRDASWPGIRAWIAANPQRVQEMLWSNPRVVFFKEEPLSDFEAGFGPRGAQGVALTPGRSVAVDPGSIPYGTPLWLASSGPQAQLQRLVLAQDTGSAIVGAVRADFFAGWGPEAGEWAGRVKQPLQLWALWPKP
jgi:membrane-bound lytic murein transglycosylase A